MKFIVPMKPYLILVSFISTMTLIMSCGPKQMTPTVVQPETKSPVVHASPVNLVAIAGDGKMRVEWQVTGSEILSGYNIYLETSASSVKNADIKPFNPDIYPGDTNPDDSVITYEAEQVANGTKYYVWVRLVRPDGTLSEPSTIDTVICGPRGELTLGVRFQSQEDGYSFANSKAVRADGADNDVYMYSKDGAVFLASPSRMNSYLRSTKFKALPFTGSLKKVRSQALTLSSIPMEDKIPVVAGQWIWGSTADGNYVLIEILSVQGKDKDQSVRFRYSYCPLKGEFPY
jgi:hypothetical protein